MSNEKRSVKFKLTLIGNPFSGKSSLRRSYLGEKYTSNYIETIGSDFSFKSIRHESGKVVNVSIWDLAGQVEYKSTHPLYYRGALGAIVVYSVVDRKSFDDIPHWIDDFYKGTKANDYPLLIIGNKIDLTDQVIVSEEEEFKLVEELRKKYPESSISSIRTSAKDGSNVETAFKSFTTRILEWIENKSKQGQNTIGIQKDMDINFPSAILMSMNQMTGPVVIANSPSLSNINEKEFEKLHSLSIKLIASLDFEDIVFHTNVLGTIPWTFPPGSLKYIAFVLENPLARGKKELYIIGLNIKREILPVINGLKGIINGYLHGLMNKFARIHVDNGLNFVVAKFDRNDYVAEIKLVEDLLLDLRKKAENALEQWYNLS